jgi:hypothetical protein
MLAGYHWEGFGSPYCFSPPQTASSSGSYFILFSNIFSRKWLIWID